MLASEAAIARGNPENPLTDNELRGKYRSLAEPVLGVARAARIERVVDALHVDPIARRRAWCRTTPCSDNSFPETLTENFVGEWECLAGPRA